MMTKKGRIKGDKGEYIQRRSKTKINIFQEDQRQRSIYSKRIKDNDEYIQRGSKTKINIWKQVVFRIGQILEVLSAPTSGSRTSDVVHSPFIYPVLASMAMTLHGVTC